MNEKQRDNTAKYLYDVSKGFLLAGVIGFFANKLDILPFLAHIGFAVYAYVIALLIDGENGNESI